MARITARSIPLMALVLAILAPAPTAHGAGELDPSFSGDGKVLTNFGAQEAAVAMAAQADGKIIAAGATSAPSGGADRNFALARYNADGSLDASFGGDGRVVTDFGGTDFASAVAIQTDGKIVVPAPAGPPPLPRLTSRLRVTTPTAAATRASAATGES